MSQINENDTTPAPAETQKDLVGDILRKERITRRITVETIAKDLKLNVKYIKALESNEYNSLPADPYVRVYLKSLAKYLSLDSEEILNRFYRERGLDIETPPKESNTRIQISMKRKEESRNPFMLVAVLLIVLLAGFSYIAKKKGWLKVPAAVPAAVPADPEFTDIEPSIDTSLADSLIPATPPLNSDTASQSSKVPLDTANLIQLRLAVVTDSVWIQVFSDGASWKNVIHRNETRGFTARDSFNVHVGNLAAVKFTLNGKSLPMTGKGVFAFKIDRKGMPIKWPLSQWNTIFRNRL